MSLCIHMLKIHMLKINMSYLRMTIQVLSRNFVNYTIEQNNIKRNKE